MLCSGPSLREGLGVEDLVPAEGRAEKAIDFRRAGTARRRRCEARSRRNDHACGGAGARRIVVVRLEHRDGEEVGAVSPGIEVGEGVDLLRRLGVDHAVAVGERTGLRGVENVGEGDAVVDHQEEREVRRLLGSLHRQIRCLSQATGSKRGK